MQQVILPKPNKKCRAVGMIHVHSTTAVINHNMTKVMDILPPSTKETLEFQNIIQTIFEPALEQILNQNALLRQQVGQNTTHPCRSLIFLGTDSKPLMSQALQQIEAMPFVKCLVDRALEETKILVDNGIDCVEVENISAPYFIGGGNGGVPWEEVVIEYIIAKKIRAAYPDLAMGVHILSCDEIEALPIAIAVGAFFIRSEATLFQGVRPEGRVQNEGNLARFMYVRRLCRQIFYGEREDTAENAENWKRNLQYPQIWSDLHKKHTHFETSIDSMTPWFENIGFCKLEGCIITGDHTGSNVNLNDLSAARTAIDSYKNYIKEKMLPFSRSGVKKLEDVVEPAQEQPPFLPLVTGSGGTFKEYAAAGADYIIVGTALKEGPYWENHVDASAVGKVLAQIAEGEKERK